VAFVPTALLCPGLQRLLDVRRVVNLRNPAHSLVKLMNPCVGKSLLVSSYTHPEYALSMAATLALMGSNALLLRGTEGEAVADPRRTPKMQAFVGGQATDLHAYQGGSLTSLPVLPTAIDAASTATYIREVLSGAQPVPAPIAQQVAHIVQLAKSWVLSTSAAVASKLPTSTPSCTKLSAWSPKVGASFTAVMVMRAVATLLTKLPSLTM
jgi:anthranilate phosphoribosyltransferase